MNVTLVYRHNKQCRSQTRLHEFTAFALFKFSILLLHANVTDEEQTARYVQAVLLLCCLHWTVTQTFWVVNLEFTLQRVLPFSSSLEPERKDDKLLTISVLMCLY